MPAKRWSAGGEHHPLRSGCPPGRRSAACWSTSQGVIVDPRAAWSRLPASRRSPGRPREQAGAQHDPVWLTSSAGPAVRPVPRAQVHRVDRRLWTSGVEVVDRLLVLAAPDHCCAFASARLRRSPHRLRRLHRSVRSGPGPRRSRSGGHHVAAGLCRWVWQWAISRRQFCCWARWTSKPAAPVAWGVLTAGALWRRWRQRRTRRQLIERGNLRRHCRH